MVFPQFPHGFPIKQGGHHKTPGCCGVQGQRHQGGIRKSWKLGNLGEKLGQTIGKIFGHDPKTCKKSDISGKDNPI